MNIRRTYLGTPTVSSILDEESVLTTLINGLDLRLTLQPIEEERISAALDLYFSSPFEQTLRGKLLTLIMALEALITRPSRPPEIVALLEEFQAKATELKKRYEVGTPESTVLEALQSELHFKTKSSISSEVRNLAKRTADFLGQDCIAAMADAKEVYTTRSLRTHRGSVSKDELTRALTKARTLTRTIMVAVLQKPSLMHTEGQP